MAIGRFQWSGHHVCTDRDTLPDLWVSIEESAKAYMDRLLGHPLVTEWLRLGGEESDVIPTLEVGA